MRQVLALIAAVFALLAPLPAAAAPAEAPAVNVDKSGVAMRGYDPVAYFTQGRPVKGSAEHQHRWKGATWRFASAAARDAFAAAPERYAPQFGGYCAWAVSQHYLAPGDPNYWKIVEGKLYLNANARAKELWEADQADAIVRGHANWPAVLTDNQSS
ncbi:MAG TPA: YHS domain-containing (seleno)protein [Sphingomicrobium sp.]|nr:YHS domain-containing (seleno)protein [Sphingomicrobium sp.]